MPRWKTTEDVSVIMRFKVQIKLFIYDHIYAQYMYYFLKIYNTCFIPAKCKTICIAFCRYKIVIWMSFGDLYAIKQLWKFCHNKIHGIFQQPSAGGQLIGNFCNCIKFTLPYKLVCRKALSAHSFAWQTISSNLMTVMLILITEQLGYYTVP